MGSCCSDSAAPPVETLSDFPSERIKEPPAPVPEAPKEAPAPAIEVKPVPVVEETKAEPTLPAPTPTPVAEEAPKPAVSNEKVSVIVFSDPAGGLKTCNFVQSPFGMTYITGAFPVVVTKLVPNAYAATLGVTVGMTILKVDGADVSKDSFETAESVAAKLKAASLKLKK